MILRCQSFVNVMLNNPLARNTCDTSRKYYNHKKLRKTVLKRDFSVFVTSTSKLKFNKLHLITLPMNARLAHEIRNYPHVSLTSIKSVLNLNKIEFEDGFTSLLIKCPMCANIKRSEMYINKVTGFTICSSCKRFGQWNEIEAILSKRRKNDDSNLSLKKCGSDSGDKWKELCDSAVSFKFLGKDEKEKIYNALNICTLPDHVTENLNLYTNEDLSSLYVPLRHINGSDVVGYKTIKLKSKEDVGDNLNFVKDAFKSMQELTEPCRDCRGILLHKTKHVKKDKAVLVHNFKDFISLACLNLNYNIICVPHGLTSLPLDVLPVLERYKKLIFWFGNKTSSGDAARQFAKKLSYDRCSFVRPLEENPSPQEVITMENANSIAKRIVDNAQPIKHQSIINFSIIREDVLSELQNIDKVQGVRWQRFSGLNTLIKGFRRGELTIVTGPTGSGKTTFLSEYSLDLLTQGVATLWGSFEVRNQRLARTMLQQFVQLPLELYPDKLNYWADSFEQLPLHFMTFHGQQPLKTVLEAVEHASYVHDTAHVIIDNVQFMLGMMDSETHLDRFYRQDALIGSFRNFATSANCHVTLVIHPRKERDAEQLTVSSVFGGAKASQEADNVYIIQQKILQSLKIKKFLQVAKNRFSGDLGLIPLEFDKETLCFSSRINKKEQTGNTADSLGVNTTSISDSNIEDLHILQ